VSTLRRDPETERLWFSVSEETHNELGEPFPYPYGAVRHHGEIVAYYGGWRPGTGVQCARESIPGRVAALCGTLSDQDGPCGLFKGPEDY
jgi:hypothetical protein